MLAIYKILLEAINEEYTKDELLNGIYPFAKAFLQHNEGLCRQHGIEESVFTYIEQKKALTKIKIAEVCASVFINEPIFKTFREYLPKKTADVLSTLVWHYSMNINQIEELLKLKVTEKKGSGIFSYNYTIKKEFLFFKAPSANYSSSPSALSIPYQLAEHLQQFYPKPKGYDIETVSTLPKTDYVYENGEELIMEELVRLIHYYAQGKVAKNKAGKILYSTANKTRKALKLHEFFEEEYKEGVSIRTHLLLQLLGTKKKVAPTTQPLDLIKSLFKTYQAAKDFNALNALTLHLKGTGYIDQWNQYKVEDNFFSILIQLPLKEWVSMENLFSFISVRRIQLELISTYDFQSKLYVLDEDDGWGYKEKNYFKRDQYQEVFHHPNVKATLFLFAAYGLIDIAYSQPRGDQYKDYYSVFDKLKYIRLNDLGAYILGLTKEYNPKNTSSGAEVVLSNTSMSIYLTEEDEGKAIMLQPFAKKVDTQRFLMDYSTFLKDCKTPKNVKDKIAVFKNTFQSDLPPLWKKFFQEMENKSSLFNTIGEHYTYHLDEDRELLALLSRDDTLKKLVIRAEDYHIIVKKQNMVKFRNKLKEYGYLI